MLQYVNDAAFGDFKDLLVDVGINNDSIPFNNLAVENMPMLADDQIFETDRQFEFFKSAYFPPLDGTTHEEYFVGWNEVPNSLPLQNLQFLSPLREEEWPQTN